MKRKLYTYKGTTGDLIFWAARLDISTETLRKRFSNEKLSMDEKFSPRTRPKKLTLSYQGKAYSVSQLSAEIDVPSSTITEKLRKGLSVDEIVAGRKDKSAKEAILIDNQHSPDELTVRRLIRYYEEKGLSQPEIIHEVSRRIAA